ncbi:carbohydrate porin [Aquitalea palustris]|uniref:Carbohydrate porin n=1 Tax=Aquitalea palustris TaxID=2480983 RepID=A0A454JG42_9NEIS|nr:carbohydrate porin [Aquitalea palustris]RMC95078.1 carbohydrate porin [Aquitalea palustris]
MAVLMLAAGAAMASAGSVQAETVLGATPPAELNPAELPEADLAVQAKPADQWTGLLNRSSLLGDMGGLRSSLGQHGITLGLSETSEYLSNVSGGLKHGGEYHGVTTLTLGLDTQRAGLWEGGTANVSVLDIHGDSFSADHVGSLQTASGTEAEATTRLWEAWFQQKLFDGKADVKIGQQSIDQEFMVSQYAGTFMGTMFGWPAIPSYDMTAGGPAYPLSGLGVRLRGRLSDQLTMLGGVFAGDPAGTSNSDAQQANKHGTAFNLHGGSLWISELQYGLNQPGDGQLDDGKPKGLPGTYKLGAWYQTARFGDQRYDDTGLSLADANSSGNAAQHRGNYSIYAVADQMVWRPAEDSSRTLNAFTRLMWAPGDRNQISFSANAGVTLTAPFDGRDSDVAGLAVGYVKVGNHLREYDQDTATANGNPLYPVRRDETFVEATYQYQITPWWQLQGDVQYTLKPGGGAVSSNDSTQTQRIPNAWVLGVKTVITF